MNIFDEFFNQIYLPIGEKIFGVNLGDYLYETTGVLMPIGLIMLGLSLIMAVMYYYVINKPKLSLWWGWGIFLIVNAILNFIIGWQWILQDVYSGDCNVSGVECGMFGFYNALLSIVVFFVWSLFVKWGSKNCSHSPF